MKCSVSVPVGVLSSISASPYVTLTHTHGGGCRYPGIAGCKNARAGTRQSRKQTLVKSHWDGEPWAVETVGVNQIDFCKGCSK